MVLLLLACTSGVEPEVGSEPDGSTDDCEPVPRDPGPFASSASVWEVELIPRNGPYYENESTIRRYTADGRQRFERAQRSGKPAVTTTTYVGLDWRIATLRVDPSDAGDSSLSQEWVWDGLQAEVFETSGYDGPITSFSRTFREDGLPLTIDYDGSSRTWTYVSDTSWQIRERTWGSTVETWEWSCLVATVHSTESDQILRRSYTPDGRLKWLETGYGGEPESLVGFRYIGDTWRIAETGDLLDPEARSAFLYEWRELLF